jgi:hypothetical protein
MAVGGCLFTVLTETWGGPGFENERKQNMRTKIGLVGVCVVVGVLAVGLASAAAAPQPETMSLLETDTVFVGTGGFPTGNAAPSVGQGFVTDGVLYKWAGAKQGAGVGHVRVVCTVTSVSLANNSGTVWTQCEVSLFLPGGLIEVAGPLSLTASANEVPIVGGTGAYVGAQGYVNHKDIGGQSSNKAVNVIHITN